MGHGHGVDGARRPRSGRPLRPLQHGTDVTVARLFNVYGPHERPDALVPRLCKSALEGRPLPLEGDALQRRDLTYIADLTPRLARLAILPALPTVNLGSGVTHSVAEVAEIVRRLHARTTFEPLSERRNEIREFRADVTLERSMLGPVDRPVSLAQGVEATYAWWKAHLMTDTFTEELNKEFAR
ncbi:NAD-dependent epimerase/dehydratase family protein [Streptomyces sp. NPDC014006]|uniref:NAD-dependent epimerase/dehydratase family protein n=1 Tax=Streptomyces sp. NPDC014006 TaxID=3364870 RepID=UPI0037028731